MLFDEPTMSMDPIVASQVLDLILRARDINRISLIYVTKKMYELAYLSNYVAHQNEDRIVVNEAPPDKLPMTRIMVLEAGKIAFTGSLRDFQVSDLVAVRELRTLDKHNHSSDLYPAIPGTNHVSSARSFCKSGLKFVKFRGGKLAEVQENQIA
jgi:ABC-type multidrug transport system ATPase subunit